jgi:hypothetical protein
VAWRLRYSSDSPLAASRSAANSRINADLAARSAKIGYLATSNGEGLHHVAERHSQHLLPGLLHKIYRLALVWVDQDNRLTLGHELVSG